MRLHPAPPNRAQGIQIPEKGSPGLGDPLFPELGNGGYDALHYSLDLDVDVRRNWLAAHSVMEARAEKELSAFNLDFRGFDIARITVNGQPARYLREGAELTVLPARPLPAGEKFEVGVDYSGRPAPYESPYGPIPLGWTNFGRGVYVVSEPDGASSWFPVNDHPRDKATYSFRVTVPQGYVAAANGVLQETTPHDGKTTFRFEAEDPMASFLATVHIGNYVRREEAGPGGIPIRHYFPADIAEEASYDFGRTAEMLEYFGQLFGPYPFKTYGAVVMDTNVGGAALETQTLPLFERDMVTGDRSMESVYVHELAHQWFGNSVSLKNWQDIWLAEGFASYAQWLWIEKEQGPQALEAQARRAHRYLRSSSGSNPVAKPAADELFSSRVYLQGALTLHALRRRLGDEAFFRTVRSFFSTYRDRSASTEDFVKMAQETSGAELGSFFQSWLYARRVPDLPA